MKNQLLLLICFFFSFTAISQEDKEELTKISSEDINMLIQDFWKVNKKPSYLSLFPLVTSVGDRRVAKIEGEGTSDFSLIETNINLSFPLFFGGKGHFERNLISLDYNINFRMTLDKSKPLTPASNHIGFSWTSTLYDSYRRWSFLKKTDYPLMEKSNKKIHFVYSRLSVRHYSNGQGAGFYYVDPDNAENFRNDYIDGDFSTNYTRLLITKGVYDARLGSLHQYTIGYRYDFGDDNPTSVLVYSAQQEQSYGRGRFLATYDYRTKRFSKKNEHHLRVDTEFIIGNLDNFNSNLKNSTGKFRFSLKAMYEFAPKNHRSIGYFVSAYYGRDYLNIRYDDIIFSLQTGITISVDKIFLP